MYAAVRTLYLTHSRLYYQYRASG